MAREGASPPHSLSIHGTLCLLRIPPLVVYPRKRRARKAGHFSQWGLRAGADSKHSNRDERVRNGNFGLMPRTPVPRNIHTINTANCCSSHLWTE